MVNPQIKSCCQKAENLVRTRLRPDLVVDVCKVCGCRHFGLKVEPGKMGIRLMPPER